jgi:hypothetical protein
LEIPKVREPEKHGGKWQDNIKMYHNEAGYEGVDWIYLD